MTSAKHFLVEAMDRIITEEDQYEKAEYFLNIHPVSWP